MASLFRPTAASMGIMRQSCRSMAKGPHMGAAAFVSRSSIMSVVSSQNAFQRSGFQTSSKRDLLPPLPQKLPGTVNDPAPLPEVHPSEGSYHWTFERIIAASLLPLAAAPFAGASLNPIMDSILCSVLVLHIHSGFQSIICDYVPPNRVPKSATLFKWGLRAGTLTVAVGLYEFETNDIGLTAAIKKIWNA
ncbi:Cytochrome b, succinate dehydrogenase small subunit, CybS [Ascosphaera apis ARSEF 7405]|uniref:Succinate dehydrogenase [ubiquinone] cytochrome b small subunit n=1 Tax=Ascosphaera apis ARSEF 7405 TaxID=392613 RepID=A0A166MZ42_9EURO|nr:Cytochrome b, succinate dehydrogenase small subunit, CybS [Ascosphaera apis ARSEF 7405]